MSTIVTRSGKGSPLTHVEVDANFTNLNTDKYQEGSAIGAVTPAAGTFTTLTATGQVNFNSASGQTGFLARLNTNGQTSGYTEFAVTDGTRFSEFGLALTSVTSYGNANEAYFRGSGSTVGTVISSASATTPRIRFITGTSANSSEQLRVTDTASAVNYVQVTGAATGSGPTISAQGSDTNAFLAITSKGTSAIRLQTGGSNQVLINNTTSAVNQIGLTGSTAGSAPQISTLGSDTNIDLTLTPKGTGATVANGDFKMNSGYGSAATAYGCRAWGNFNGTGTVAIRASGNVSSITDNGTGDYTVNFTTAMPDANYCYELSGQRIANASNYNAVVSSVYTLSTTALRVNTSNDVSNTLEDFSAVCVAIFR